MCACVWCKCACMHACECVCLCMHACICVCVWYLLRNDPRTHTVPATDLAEVFSSELLFQTFFFIIKGALFKFKQPNANQMTANSPYPWRKHKLGLFYFLLLSWHCLHTVLSVFRGDIFSCGTQISGQSHKDGQAGYTFVLWVFKSVNKIANFSKFLLEEENLERPTIILKYTVRRMSRNWVSLH